MTVTYTHLNLDQRDEMETILTQHGIPYEVWEEKRVEERSYGRYGTKGPPIEHIDLFISFDVTSATAAKQELEKFEKYKSLPYLEEDNPFLPGELEQYEKEAELAEMKEKTEGQKAKVPLINPIPFFLTLAIFLIFLWAFLSTLPNNY